MWIFFEGGRFVSAVKYSPLPKERKPKVIPRRPLLVRGRTREDLSDFLRLAELRHGFRITDSPKADYPFRAIVPAAYVSRCLVAAASGIEYDNFKGTIGMMTPAERLRHEIAMDIWVATRRLHALNRPVFDELDAFGDEH